MAVKWTKEQRQVIDLRDRNILVSAAAGSGKTAVLVERIISMITDEKNPVDVDKLLVVTYTEAAAAEMKERIAAAIEKKLEESPGNLNLEQQASLIHSAMITTVHKFCLSVIRDHFHVIGIDPSFRVGEEGELRLLKQDVLDEMLEEHYAKDEEEFREFVEKYGTGRTDKKIEELILQLYEYSRSYPDPRQWLISCAEDYEIEDLGVAKAYGLDVLIKVMGEALPEELMDTLQHVQIVCLEEKKRLAQAAVATAAVAAAGEGAAPIPFSDCVFLIPTQVGMIASITVIFGFDVNKSIITALLSSSIGAGGATLLGKTVVTNILKFIPGAGTVVGGAISAGTAGVITVALGEAYIGIMELVFKGEMSIDDLGTKKGKETMTALFKEQLKKER